MNLSHLKAYKRKTNKKTWSSMMKNKPSNPTEISMKTLKTPKTLTTQIWVKFNSRQKNWNLRALMILQWRWENSPHKRGENQNSSTKTLIKFRIKQSHNQLKIKILLLHQKQTLWNQSNQFMIELRFNKNFLNSPKDFALTAAQMLVSNRLWPNQQSAKHRISDH